MTADDDHHESSKRQPHGGINDTAIIEIVESLGVAGTTEIRDTIEERHGWDADRSTIYRRLDNLTDQGEIASHHPGHDKRWMSIDAFQSIIDDQQFLEAIKDEGGMATTDEISEAVGSDIQSTVRRLQELEHNDEIAGREMGESTIWTHE